MFKSTGWHSTCVGQRWPCVADVARLSAAFDTVDHVTLRRRLENLVSYGISGTVYIIPECSPTVRLKRIYKLVDAYCRAVWSPTIVGSWSNPFLVVHGRLVKIHGWQPVADLGAEGCSLPLSKQGAVATSTAYATVCPRRSIILPLLKILDPPLVKTTSLCRWHTNL